MQCEPLVAEFRRAFAPGTPPRPLVSIRTHDAVEGDCVVLDQSGAARDAAASLAARGCRSLAYLGPAYASENDPRHRACREAAAVAGLPFAWIRSEDETRAAARAAVRRHREGGSAGAFDCLMCRNDDLALGAYRGLRDLGLRVPEDVALIGCDGIEDSEYLEVPLSTIVKPVEAMARTAWQFLKCRLSEPDLPPQVATLTARFEERASSRRT